MTEINELYQQDLEQQIKNAILSIGLIAREPHRLQHLSEYSHQLLIKFNEYADNTRLLANQPKENVLL